MAPAGGDPQICGSVVLTAARASAVRDTPPSLSANSTLLLVPLYCGWKTMRCWSAWLYWTSLLPNHQKLAVPQFVPPSSDRHRSMPPTHTRFGSRGSTTMVLSYQP